MTPEEIRENINNLIWDHAVQLGVPGRSPVRSWSFSTDPEALTILVGLSKEARLHREWTGWLLTFGDVLYPARLKKMINELLHQDDVSFSPKGFGRIQTILASVNGETKRSLDPALRLLENFSNSSESISGKQAKVLNVNKQPIVSRVPRLFWRHIVGVNARAEVLSALNWNCSGNSHQLARDLHLTQHTIYRALQSLKLTGVLQLKKVQKEKVMVRGDKKLMPEEHREEYFVDWSRVIRAVLEIQSKTQSLETPVEQELEERYSHTVKKILSENLLDYDFDRRHGEIQMNKIMNRIKK